MARRVGAIEAGGTKIVCAAGSGPDDLEEVRFPTEDPESTLAKIVDFLGAQGELEAIGIGTFGPAGINPHQPESYGRILKTPKPGWEGADFLTPLRAKFGTKIPIHFDTDVNAAAFGEGKWGAAQDIHTFLYLTVGTGIGGGAIVDGRILHGALHPEIGHLKIPHDFGRDPYAGHCPFHHDCLEGLAAGPAIAERWGKPARQLSPDHEAWDLEAHYLALALTNLSLTLSPQKIILGGGVMNQAQLFPLICEALSLQLNGYLEPPEIAPPGLGDRAGILGALALAQR
ncbi:MAG: fructokinase [Verrucomicrobiales bacterium]|jgi:fructokinase